MKFLTSPNDYADLLGVRVRHGWLPDGAWGSYDVELHVITIARQLAPVQYMCTLMHEFGHAYYRHAGTSPLCERQADRWAARELIHPEDFLDAALEDQSDQGLAHQLGVLPCTVRAYVETLTHREWTYINRHVGYWRAA